MTARISASRTTGRRMQQRTQRWTGWTYTAVGLIASIVLPFLIFGSTFDSETLRALGNERSRAMIAILAGIFLATDVFLPIPSSVISTVAGRALGFAFGTLVSAGGMTAGCLLGYAVGRRVGRKVVIRLTGADSFRDAERIAQRCGVAALALLRAVPVLAEASVLLAGTTGVRFVPFLAVTTLANLGISTVYAAAGAHSAAFGSFLLAFAAATLIPATGLLLMRAWRRASGTAAEARDNSPSQTDNQAT
jgi:uncharacterized membrane protein YdjX (TVP38/TMEM64 family)